MMGKLKHMAEQFVIKFQEAAKFEVDGKTNAEIAHAIQSSETILARWLKMYRQMNPAQVQEFQALQGENLRLEKIASDPSWKSLYSRSWLSETSNPRKHYRCLASYGCSGCITTYRLHDCGVSHSLFHRAQR